jgi:hypothetical protein
MRDLTRARMRRGAWVATVAAILYSAGAVACWLGLEMSKLGNVGAAVAMTGAAVVWIANADLTWRLLRRFE